MAISEKELLEAGFSKSEVDNLQGRLAAGGGTMQHLIDALSRRGMDHCRAGSGYAGHPHCWQPDTHSFRGHEFPCRPDHCLGDLPTCTGLESIPPAEDYFPEGSIVSKSSATLALTPHPAILSAIAGRGVPDTFLKKSGLVQYHSRCASGFSLRP